MTKNYKIGIRCFCAKHANLRGRVNTSWLGFRRMCSSRTTGLTKDYYVSELALQESN